MERKISTSLGFLIIFVVIIPTAWICYSKWLELVEVSNTKIGVGVSQDNKNITSAEEELIDQWIIANNLNEYGDPKETIYTGGTPLFNEATGETLNKYEYILSKHPGRPWNK